MNQFTYFSHNGNLLSTADATIALSNIEYAYGYGVYENIRVSKGQILFLMQHGERLLASADIIGIEHGFTKHFIIDSVRELVAKNQVAACNVKILLIGGRTPDDAQLYIQCLHPLFPDRKLYKTGVHCITAKQERTYPHAKSLNMLPSYLAYRTAKRANAYDALLIDRHTCITEGTRTNFFGINGRTIISPPAEDILLGVTRDNVLAVADRHNFDFVEQAMLLDDITDYEGVFLTSTSSKIMPIRSIDDYTWPQIPETLHELMEHFNRFLDEQVEH